MGLLTFSLLFTAALQTVPKDVLKSWTSIWRDGGHSREEGVGLGLLCLFMPLLPSLIWTQVYAIWSFGSTAVDLTLEDRQFWKSGERMGRLSRYMPIFIWTHNFLCVFKIIDRAPYTYKLRCPWNPRLSPIPSKRSGEWGPQLKKQWASWLGFALGSKNR